jgi:hypothetical protein
MGVDGSLICIQQLLTVLYVDVFGRQLAYWVFGLKTMGSGDFILNKTSKSRCLTGGEYEPIAIHVPNNNQLVRERINLISLHTWGCNMHDIAFHCVPTKLI